MNHTDSVLHLLPPQVVGDAAAAEAPADAVVEGGDTPPARRGTFLDLALCLAGGLQDAGLATLFKTAAIGLPVRFPVLSPYNRGRLWPLPGCRIHPCLRYSI